MANLAATHSSARTGDTAKDEWGTPPWLFGLLHCEFGFTLDVAASDENAKVARYFTKEDDGLSKPWTGEICWCNPPYSQAAKWIQKAHLESTVGTTTVLLIGARPDTQYWWNHVRYGEVRFLPGRLRFLGATRGGAPFPSAVVIFRGDMLWRSPSTIYWDVHDPDRKRRKR